jgi:hypothetical protein
MERVELTKVDEKVSPSLPLTNRERHDTADVVRRTTLLLGEVADELSAAGVGRGHHVEEERLDVVVERLVVQEHLGKETQILAVDLGEGEGQDGLRYGISGLTLFLRPSTSNTETFPSR